MPELHETAWGQGLHSTTEQANHIGPGVGHRRVVDCLGARGERAERRGGRSASFATKHRRTGIVTGLLFVAGSLAMLMGVVALVAAARPWRGVSRGQQPQPSTPPL
jgi:hypothetical protein